MKYSLLILVFCAGFLAHALWVAAIKGRLFGFLYACSMIAGLLADVVCQLWIDLSGLFRRKKWSDRFKGKYHSDPEDIF